MGDIVGNPTLNKKRLAVHVKEVELSIERLELRKLEIADELKKIEENQKAMQADIQRTLTEISKI